MSDIVHPELADFIEFGRAILQNPSVPAMWRAFEDWDKEVGDWLALHYPHSGYVAKWTGMVAEGLYTGPGETEVACLTKTIRRRIEWLGWMQERSSLENPSKAASVASAARKGYQFEREVAAVYRALGGRVEHDVVLAGNQIDIVVQEHTGSGSSVRTAIECKAFTRPVGVDVVNRFASLIALLKQRGLIDRGTLVTTSGFTSSARSAGREMAIELLEMADVEQRVLGKDKARRHAENEIDEARKKAEEAPDRPLRLFVVMPFASDFDDVYLLGIRDVAEKLGYVVDRADDIEHNENILDVVQVSIKRSDAVIADISGRNPNVYYEVGFAHAVDRPTVLLCRKDDDIPFDLQSINCIRYGSIIQLRERLERRLGKMFDR